MSLFRFVTRFPFFRSASVEKAISGLTKAVAELDRVVTEESVDIDLRSQQIADLQLANYRSETEVYRAKAIARRISDLIG